MPLQRRMNQELNRILRDNSAFRWLAVDCLDVLDGNPALVFPADTGEEFRIPFLDIYCQTMGQHKVSLEDRITAALAWQRILRRDIIYDFIQVRDQAFANDRVAENREILTDMVGHYKARGLYDLASADFWGGSPGADGQIAFSQPFIREDRASAFDAKGKEVPLAEVGEASAGTQTVFPLEVGYCMPNQIEAHLRDVGCVARWPYGHRWIVFMEATGRYREALLGGKAGTDPAT